MKAFFVLCATLSVIQVIFIGESTAAWGEDYEDYNPKNYGLDRRTASPQNDRQLLRPPSAASRRLEPEIYNEQDGSVDRRLSRNRSYKREPQYPQLSPRFNNKDYGLDYAEMVQQPFLRKQRDSLLGNIMRIPADAVENVGSILGNKVNNIHKITTHGIRKLSDAGDRITNRMINNMDSGSKMFDAFGNNAYGVLNAGAEIPRRFARDINGRITNFPNVYNQFENELANGKRLATEYIPNELYPFQEKYPRRRQYPLGQEEPDAYYEPEEQLPSPLPQRKIQKETLNEEGTIPARKQKMPSQPTLEKLPEKAKKVVAPLTPSKKGQKSTLAQAPIVEKTPAVQPVTEVEHEELIEEEEEEETP